MRTKQIVKSIESIYIPVTNPEVSANWYQKYLSLELIRPVSENQGQLKVSENQTLFLIKTKEKTTLNFFEIGGDEMPVMTLEVNDLENLFKKFKNGNEKIDDIEDNDGCGLSFHAFDPDGNKLHIWAGWPQQ
jgi:Glyoxalase/Bleomycin resistance protein/Dioxygenase superfamily